MLFCYSRVMRIPQIKKSWGMFALAIAVNYSGFHKPCQKGVLKHGGNPIQLFRDGRIVTTRIGRPLWLPCWFVGGEGL